MTSTLSEVTRSTVGAYSTLYAKALPVVVTITRHDTLQFRCKGRRFRVELPIEAAFRYAIRRLAGQEWARKQLNKRKRP